MGRRGLFLCLSTILVGLGRPIFVVGVSLGLGGFVGGFGLCCLCIAIGLGLRVGVWCL